MAGEGPALADMCAQTVRHHHPNARIVHLTDTDTPPLALADECWRGHWDREQEPVMLFRMRMWARLDDEPTLLLDSDVLLRDVVDDVFEQDFDVALTRREKPIPFNAGVIFAKNGDFFRALLYEARDYDPSEFIITEKVLPQMVLSRRWNVLELPCTIWNCSRFEPHYINAAKVLHYKGFAKSRMPIDYERGVWQ